MINRRTFLTSTGSALVFPAMSYASQDAIRMRELYNKDLSFSATAEELTGKRIDVLGYMAPPLKAKSAFFVLTKKPMSVCPFCETDADWPDDILAIYTKRTVKVKPFNVKLVVSGVLDLGSQRDEETGFLSRVRLIDATYKNA